MAGCIIIPGEKICLLSYTQYCNRPIDIATGRASRPLCQSVSRGKLRVLSYSIRLKATNDYQMLTLYVLGRQQRARRM